MKKDKKSASVRRLSDQITDELFAAMRSGDINTMRAANKKATIKLKKLRKLVRG